MKQFLKSQVCDHYPMFLYCSQNNSIKKNLKMDVNLFLVGVQCTCEFIDGNEFMKTGWMGKWKVYCKYHLV